MDLHLTSRHCFKQPWKRQRYFHTVLKRVLTKLPRNLKWICLPDFRMVLTNVSKWGIMVLCWLDMADTLTFFLKNFRQNWRMRIIIPALILVVALSTLSMELFEPILKNLNKPWRNFWRLHLWFYTTPQEEGKFFNLFLQFLPNKIWIMWIITAIFQKCVTVCF